jgi:hypothetical protein
VRFFFPTDICFEPSVFQLENPIASPSQTFVIDICKTEAGTGILSFFSLWDCPGPSAGTRVETCEKPASVCLFLQYLL